MSRTHRKMHPRTRLWINRVDINPLTLEPYLHSEKRKRTLDRQRRGNDGIGYGERCTSATIDSAGNWKINNWTLRWGRSRFTNSPQRIQRQANKIKIQLGIEDWMDDQILQEDDDTQAWYDAMEAEYLLMLEEEEEYYLELDRQNREQELDDYFHYYDGYDYDYDF